MLVVSPGSPVEVLTVISDWVKVREAGGRLAWARAADVVPRRTIVVTVPTAVVRAKAADDATPVFEARQGVILQLLDASGPWLRVRHAQGPTGYVRVSEVWGAS